MTLDEAGLGGWAATGAAAGTAKGCEEAVGSALVEGAGCDGAEYETGPEAITLLLLLLAAGANHTRGVSTSTASYRERRPGLRG